MAHVECLAIEAAEHSTLGVLANGLFGGLGLHPGLIRDAAGRDNVRPGRTAVRLNLKFSSRFSSREGEH